MLYTIVFEEKTFETCINLIKYAYYPQNEFETVIDSWSDHDIPLEPEKLQGCIKKSLEVLIKKISQKKFYVVDPNPLYKPEPDDFFLLPFLSEFYKLFLERAWPVTTLSSEGLDNLYILHQEKNKNYSKHSANFNHFVNLVAAVARLINYFSNKKEGESGIKTVSKFMDEKTVEILKCYEKSICYTENQDQKFRILMLMLASFYHDIGKSVTDARHGMEGAIILSESTGESWSNLKSILKEYSSNFDFTREDLLFISDTILYHDLFGTLSTGESGYLRLIEVIDRIKKYSLKNDIESEKWSQRYLFDLWLLNAADIMVSIIDHKGKDQEIWRDKKSSFDNITEFFHSKQGITLLHDLVIAIQLLDKHNDAKSLDNLPELRKLALLYSKGHVIERIRRLIYISLEKAIINYEGPFEADDFIEAVLIYIEEDYRLSAIIKNVIGSVANFNNFSDRFSYIAFMDYSLGFFQKITEYILGKVMEEINEKTICTYWISTDEISNWKGKEDDFWQMQARYFVDNYTAVVIHIISLLIFKDEKIDKIRNLEFKDAADRLKDKKIEAILALSGPYKERYSTNLILQTIFYW